MGPENLRIKVSGYQPRCATAARELLEDNLIDIAWVDQVGDGFMTIMADAGTDFAKSEDYDWVKRLIDELLRRHWIYAKLELIQLAEGDAP